MNREIRNPQFDFLKQMHHHHKLFNTLVEHYTRVLLPPHDWAIKLDSYCDKEKLYQRILERVGWEKMQAKAKEQENEEEKERMERALIDWHDFIIVETITFEDETKPSLMPMPAPSVALPAEPLKPEKSRLEMAFEDIDMEMDVEMDMDDEVEMKIRRDYPTKGRAESVTDDSLKYSICPKCGEKIPIEEMEEHMKIELLDPVARQKKLEQMQRRRETPLAEGADISKNLRTFSKYRSDIFEDEEGKERDESTQKPKIIWDGHTGSIAATASAVMSGMTAEEKARAIAKAEAEKPQIGAAMPGKPAQGILPTIPAAAPPQKPLAPTPSAAHMTMPPMMPQGMGAPGMHPMMHHPMGGMPHHPMMGAPGMPGGMSHPMMGAPGMMPPAGMGMPPGSVPGMPGQMHPAPPLEGEPSQKKQKTGPALMDEQEFLAKHKSPLEVKVSVPAAEEHGAKPEWNFQGQTLALSAELKQSVADLKNLIKDRLGGMPPAKQKLEIKGIGVLKDNVSLAYYNVTEDTVISLGVKTRGRGGKK